MDDLVRAVLIALGVLVVLGLALIAFLMWRFKIPPRGLVAMLGALAYLALPIDVVPEALLGPLGLVDDTGVVAAVAIWVYRLVKAEGKTVADALADVLADYQNPVPREVMEFQIALAVREASDLDFVPPVFRDRAAAPATTRTR